MPILELSGAAEKVRDHGFQVKRGAIFQWGSDEWIIDWGDMVRSDANSWQVERSIFDNLLLEHAAEQGVKVHQQARAKRVAFTDERPSAVEWVDSDGTAHTTACDFVVDASGRAGILAQHFKLRQQHEVFRNVATWAYWKGSRPLPQAPEGAVHSISTPDGWIWAIPLAGDKLSVGYVTHKDSFGRDRPTFGSAEEYYLAKIADSKSVSWMLEGAERTTDTKIEQDYSYVASRFCGPGYLIVGDAACFLDPLLSTGVHLGMYSSMIGAAALSSIAHGDLPEAKALDFFEYSYRRAYSRLIVLVSHLYQRYDDKESYFYQAQKLRVDDEGQSPLHSFMDITAGRTDMREARSADSRIVTDVLVKEAEAAREVANKTIDTTTPNDARGIPELDMSALRDLWDSHDASSKSDNEHRLYVETSPRLRLRRVEA